MKKRGMFLIYVLFTAVLISIFLITAIQNMQNSYFITNKFACENKAYWAAEAGLQYCEYKLKLDLGWPFVNAKITGNNQTGTEKFGKFKITSSLENNGKGYYIHGVSENNDEEFCIYFAQKKSQNNTNIVPNLLPSNPSNISYCSYNSIAEENLESLMKKNDNITYQDIQFTVSNSPKYKAIIITPGVYIISDGRFKGYRTVLEKMFVADYGNTYGGGIYAGGDIDINLVNQNNSIKVNQVSNSRPKVYCKKDIKISRNSEWINTPFSPITNKKLNYLFPFSINDGTIYMNNLPYYFEVKQQIHNGKNHGLETISNNGNSNKENDKFKQKYGINIEEYQKSNDNLFPKVMWKEIEKIKEKEEMFKTQDGKPLVENIDAGSYIAIFNDDTSQYDLIWVPLNILKENAEIDSDTLQTIQENLIQAEKDKINSILSSSSSYNKDGKFIAQDELEQAQNKLKNKIKDRTGLINLFVTANNGKIINGYERVYNDVGNGNNNGNNDILTDHEDKQVTSDVFDIKTAHINIIKSIEELPVPKPKEEKNKNKEKTAPPPIIEKYKINYDNKTTPIISLKKSLNINGDFNLLTLIISDSEDNLSFKFQPDTNISTDLIFGKKITGFNEPYELAKGLDDENKTNLIAGTKGVNIYSNGSVIINGKLSGKGQIFSKKNLFFRAGTALNTNDYEDIKKEYDEKKDEYVITEIKEKENVGEISKIALYSKGTIIMKAPSGENEEDLDELHNKIKHLLVGETSKGEKKENKITGDNPKEITNKILFSEVNLEPQDLVRVASSINQMSDKPVTSKIIVNDLRDKITLSKLMRKYYGFEDREAKDYIEEIIRRNYIYDEKTDSFKMPDNYEDIEIISTRSSSSFSGLIYACGGFFCDAENNNIVINGTIVSYGADPASSTIPGSKSGLNDDLLLIKDKKDQVAVDFTRKPGTIKITNCKDFSIVYDSTDLATFVYKYSADKPIHLSSIYCNKL